MILLLDGDDSCVGRMRLQHTILLKDHLAAAYLYFGFTLEETFEHNDTPQHLLLDSEDDSNLGLYPTGVL
jgi:hypothetical protein